MKLLVDTALSVRIARAMDVLLQPGHTATHVFDLGGGKTTDLQITDFLQHDKDTALIGIDLDMADHPHRRAALLEWSRPVFLLTSDWLDDPPENNAWKIMNLMPAILKKIRSAAIPAVYLISPGPGVRIRKAT